MTADRASLTSRKPGPVRGHSVGVGRGILCMIAGSALLTSGDAVVKWLAAELPVGQIIFIRGGILVLLVLAVIAATGSFGALRVHNKRDMALRAVLVAVSTLMFLNSLRFLPLADAIAIVFANPLITTALAVPLLAERVGWRRWSAVIVGFGGVLLMAQPQGGIAHWAVLLVLGAALLASLRDILTRRLNATEASLGILFYTSVAVTLAGLATAPLGWVPMPPMAWLLVIGGAGLVGGAHYLQIEAFRYADASTVSPYRYVTLIWAVLLGFVIWGDLPTIPVVAGAAIIVLSGLYVWYREGRRAGGPAGGGHGVSDGPR